MLSLYSGSITHHQPYLAQGQDVARRVAVHRQEVGPLARLERAHLVAQTQEISGRRGPEEPAVAAGHGDGSARRYHPRSREDAELDCSGYVYRETIRRADIADGGDAGVEVQSGVVRAAERRQSPCLAFDDLMRLGRGAPDQVDVGVDQAGQERRVAEVHHPRTGGWLPDRSYRDDAPVLHE